MEAFFLHSLHVAASVMQQDYSVNKKVLDSDGDFMLQLVYPLEPSCLVYLTCWTSELRPDAIGTIKPSALG